MATWMIVPSGDEFDLLRNGRSVLVDLPLAVLKIRVRKRRKPGDRVWLQEPDGYRQEITRSI